VDTLDICKVTCWACQPNWPKRLGKSRPQSASDFYILTFSHFFNHPRNTLLTAAIMGRVRTKTVKKSAKVIIERYYPKLSLDFEVNKRICDEIAIIASKRLRNKVHISFVFLPFIYYAAFTVTGASRGKRSSGEIWNLGLDDPLLIGRDNTDCWLHHPSHETYSARACPWYLIQAARRGAWAERSIRARGLSARLHTDQRDWSAGCGPGD